jgi:hypothetical protein
MGVELTGMSLWLCGGPTMLAGKIAGLGELVEDDERSAVEVRSLVPPTIHRGLHSAARAAFVSVSKVIAGLT